MKKWRIYHLAVILILSIQSNIHSQEVRLIKTTRIQDYPSASSLEFHNNKLYVIGDDAADLLVLDKDHTSIDRIKLFDSKKNRLSKKKKADLEASTLFTNNNKTYLVGFGSFSTSKRNKIVIVDIDAGKNKSRNKVTTLSSSIRHPAIKETNIEGAALVNNKLLLTNRANNANKENYLLVTTFNTKNGIGKKMIPIKVNLEKGGSVLGFSGITYVKSEDLLLFTASTENTANATADGSIGDSYIGYIINISQKLNQSSINVDKLIDITTYLANSDPQKIESLAVEQQKGNELIIHLASDNDNGETTLFKLNWQL